MPATHPTAGNYRLSFSLPWCPIGLILDVAVGASNLVAMGVTFAWNEDVSAFLLGDDIAIECHGDGTFQCVWGTLTVSGTCELLT